MANYIIGKSNFSNGFLTISVLLSNFANECYFSGRNLFANNSPAFCFWNQSKGSKESKNSIKTINTDI